MTLKTIASITALASALVCAAAEMPFIDVLKPDKMLVDGAEDSAGRVKLVPCRCLRLETSVLVSGEAPISRVELVWNVSLPKDTVVYGSDWERNYGDSGWFRMDGPCGPHGGWKPWYCLVNDGKRTGNIPLHVWRRRCHAAEDPRGSRGR